jgi:hypothetical protein
LICNTPAEVFDIQKGAPKFLKDVTSDVLLLIDLALRRYFFVHYRIWQATSAGGYSSFMQCETG